MADERRKCRSQRDSRCSTAPCKRAITINETVQIHTVEVDRQCVPSARKHALDCLHLERRSAVRCVNKHLRIGITVTETERNLVGCYGSPDIFGVRYCCKRRQPELNRVVRNVIGVHAALNEHLIAWAKYSLQLFGEGLRHAGKLIIEFCFVLITVFFCFRDGKTWLIQLQMAIGYFFDDEQGIYLKTLGHTTRAVCYGLVLAALGQGIIAGIGYALAGVSAPLLLGAFTALMALIPMGATLVWIPTGLLLLANENIWAGLGLLAWGFLVVSTVDNVIRPLIICGASRVPFLVVLFGVFGGLTAFGAIGLFLGPMILALLLAVWQVNITKIQLNNTQ